MSYIWQGQYKVTVKAGLASRLTILQLQSKYNVADSDLGEEIARTLSAAGYYVISAFLKGGDARTNETAADRLHCFNFSEFQLKGLWRFATALKLYGYCKDNNIDLIIAHRFKQIHIADIVNRWLQIPVVGVVHGLGDYDRSYRRRMLKSFLGRQWKFVGVSQAVKTYLMGLEVGATDSNVSVINNAIDIERSRKSFLSREKARKLLGVEDNSLIVGTIGRMVPVKGHKYLVSAIQALVSDYPSLKLVIIGDGRERESIERMITDYNLAENVILTGWKDNASRYLSGFDIFAFPSLSEGLPLALLEAMSAGLPVICSDIDALASVAPPESVLVPTKDSDALARGMTELLSKSCEERAVVGQLAFEYLSDNHSVEDFRREYHTLVAQLLEPAR